MRAAMVVLCLAAGAEEGRLTIEECRKILAVFEEIGMPDPRGREFVRYNYRTLRVHRGKEVGRLVPFFEEGWVLDESEDWIRLSGGKLIEVEHSRKGLVILKDLPEVHTPGPPPGEKEVLDFETVCRDLLRSGVVKPGLSQISLGGGLPFAFEPALYAWWALRLGRVELAWELVELMRKEIDSEGLLDPLDLADRLREAVVSTLEEQATWGALGDEPASSLLRIWRMIDRVSPGYEGGEAAEMVDLYERVVEEQRAFRDPSPAELARLSPREQARVWIHRLLPGTTKSTERIRQEIIDLGPSALPAVIAHLHDRRPARILEPTFAGDPHVPRIEDHCRLVFRSLTGFHFDRIEVAPLLREWSR